MATSESFQSINELNLSHWEKYMRLNHQEINLQASDLFANNEDYEQDPITDALLETTSSNIVFNNNYNNIYILFNIVYVYVMVIIVFYSSCSSFVNEWY